MSPWELLHLGSFDQVVRLVDFHRRIDATDPHFAITVRTTGRITSPAEFNQIAVAQKGPYVVRISDIGNAEDSYEEPRTAARLDGTSSVTLLIAKQSGENSVATAAGIRDRMKERK